MSYTEKVDTTNPLTQSEGLGQNITPSQEVENVQNFNPKNEDVTVPNEGEGSESTQIPFTQEQPQNPTEELVPQDDKTAPNPNVIDHDKLKDVLRQLWTNMEVNNNQRDALANIYNDNNNAYVKFFNAVENDDSVLDNLYNDMLSNVPESQVFFNKYGDGKAGFKSYLYGNAEKGLGKEKQQINKNFQPNPKVTKTIDVKPVTNYNYDPKAIVENYKKDVIDLQSEKEIEYENNILESQISSVDRSLSGVNRFDASELKRKNEQITKNNQKLSDNRHRKEMSYFMDNYLINGNIKNYAENNRINVNKLGRDVMKDMYPEKYKALSQKEQFLSGKVTAEQAEESLLDSFYKTVFSSPSITDINNEVKTFNINTVKTLNRDERLEYFKKYLSYGLSKSEKENLDKWSIEGVSKMLKAKYGFTDNELDLIFTPAFETEQFKAALEKENVEREFITSGIFSALTGIRTYMDKIQEDGKDYQSYINGASELIGELTPEWESIQSEISKYLDKDGEVLDIVKGVQKHADAFNAAINKQNKFLERNPIWNEETFDNLESYVQSPYFLEIQDHMALYEHVFQQYKKLESEYDIIFPLISTLTNRNELIDRLQNEQLRNIKETNRYNDRILRTEKLSDDEKEVLQDEKISLFGAETILGIKSSIRHWGKNLVSLPKLRELVVDGGRYSYFDYAADMYSASLDRYEHKDKPFSNPLFEHVVEVDIDGDKYSVLTNDVGEILSNKVIRDNDDLNVYDENLRKLVLDKYNKGNKDETNLVSTNTNNGFAFKSSKVISDLVFQIAITKGVGGAFSRVAQPLIKQAQLYKKAYQGGSLFKKGATTGIIPSARNAGVDSFGMHLGIFSAITAQTNEEFRKKGREAGLYGDALEQYVMTQTAMISLINLINPNVRMHAGKRNFVERLFNTRTPAENLKARLSSGKVAGKGSEVINTTKYKGVGQWLAGTNGAARLQLKDGAKTIFLRGAAESVEEMTELPGEVLVNHLWSQFKPTSDKTIESLSEDKRWLNFRMSELPDVNMFAESGILGFVGGAGHAMVSVGNNIVQASRFPDSFDASILADYMNDPDGMKKMLMTLEGEYIYAPPGKQITYDLEGEGGLTLATKKSLQDISRALDGLVEQAQEYLPPEATDAEKGMVMSLIGKKSHFGRELDKYDKALKAIIAASGIQSTEDDDKNKIEDKLDISLKLLQKGLSAIDNQLEQIKTRGPKSPVKIKTVKELKQGNMQYNFQPISTAELSALLSDEEWVEQTVNAHADPKTKFNDGFLIDEKSLTPKLKKLWNNYKKKRKNAVKRVEALNKNAKTETTGSSMQLNFVPEGTTSINQDGGYTIYDELEDGSLDESLKGKSVKKREHVLLPNGMLYVETVVEDGNKEVTQNEVYVRLVDNNGDNELIIVYNATPVLNSDGKVLDAKPENKPVKIMHVTKKGDAIVELKKLDNELTNEQLDLLSELGAETVVDALSLDINQVTDEQAIKLEEIQDVIRKSRTVSDIQKNRKTITIDPTNPDFDITVNPETALNNAFIYAKEQAGINQLKPMTISDTPMHQPIDGESTPRNKFTKELASLDSNEIIRKLQTVDGIESLYMLMKNAETFYGKNPTKNAPGIVLEKVNLISNLIDAQEKSQEALKQKQQQIQQQQATPPKKQGRGARKKSKKPVKTKPVGKKQKQLQSLEGQIDKAKGRVQEVQDTLNKLSEQLESLTDRVAELESNPSRTKKQNADLTRLKTQIESNKAQYKSKSKTLEKAVKSVEGLSGKLSAAKGTSPKVVTKNNISNQTNPVTNPAKPFSKSESINKLIEILELQQSSPAFISQFLERLDNWTSTSSSIFDSILNVAGVRITDVIDELLDPSKRKKFVEHFENLKDNRSVVYDEAALTRTIDNLNADSKVLTLMDDIVNSLTNGKITEDTAKKFITTIFENWLNDSIANPTYQKIPFLYTGAIRRANELIQLFEDNTDERKSLVELLENSIAKNNLNKQNLLSSLPFWTKGANKFRKLSNGQGFFGNSPHFNDASASVKQRVLKRLIPALSKIAGTNIEDIVDYNNDVYSREYIDSKGNRIVWARHKSKNGFVSRLSQLLDGNEFENFVNENGGTENMTTNRFVSLLYRFAERNNLSEEYVDNAFIQLGLYTNITDWTKRPRTFLFGNLMYLIKSPLNLEYQYAINKPTVGKLVKKAGKWVGLRDSKTREDFFTEEGKTKVINFQDFSSSNIGNKISIVIHNDTKNDEMYGTGYIYLRTSHSAAEVKYRLKANDLGKLESDLRLEANKLALRLYNQLNDGIVAIPNKEIDQDTKDGYSTVKVYPSGFKTNNDDVSDTTGEFVYRNEDGKTNDGIEVKYRFVYGRALSSNDASNVSKYMEIDFESIPKGVSPSEFIGILGRLAKSQGFTNIAIRKTSKNSNIFSQRSIVGQGNMGILGESKLKSTKGKDASGRVYITLTNLFGTTDFDTYSSTQDGSKYYKLSNVRGYTPNKLYPNLIGASVQNQSNIWQILLSGTKNNNFATVFGADIYESLEDANRVFTVNNADVPGTYKIPQMVVDQKTLNTIIPASDWALYENAINKLNATFEGVYSIPVAKALGESLTSTMVRTARDLESSFLKTNEFNTAFVELSDMTEEQLSIYKSKVNEKLTNIIKSAKTEIAIAMMYVNEVESFTGNDYIYSSADISKYTDEIYLLDDEFNAKEGKFSDLQNKVQERISMVYNNSDLSQDILSVSESKNVLADLKFAEFLFNENPNVFAIAKTRAVEKVNASDVNLYGYNSNLDNNVSGKVVEFLLNSDFDIFNDFVLSNNYQEKLAFNLFNTLRQRLPKNLTKGFDLENLTNKDLLKSRSGIIKSLIRQMSHKDLHDSVNSAVEGDFQGQIETNIILGLLGIDGYTSKHGGTDAKVTTMLLPTSISGQIPQAVETIFNLIQSRNIAGLYNNNVDEGNALSNNVRVLEQYYRMADMGGYDPFSNRISLTGTNANSLLELESPTALVHEVGHIFKTVARGKFGQEFKRITELIKTSEDPKIEGYRNKVFQLYQSQLNNPNNLLYHNNMDMLAEEVFVQMLSDVVVKKLVEEESNRILSDFGKVASFAGKVVNSFFSFFGFDFSKTNNLADLTLENLIDDIAEKEFLYKDGKLGVYRRANEFMRKKLPSNWLSKRYDASEIRSGEYVNQVKNKTSNERFAAGLAWRNPLYFFADKSDLNKLGRVKLTVKAMLLDNNERIKQFAESAKKAGFDMPASFLNSFVLRDGKVEAQRLDLMQKFVDETASSQSWIKRVQLADFESEAFKNATKNMTERQAQDYKVQVIQESMAALNALYVNHKGLRETVDEYLNRRADLKSKVLKADQQAKKDFASLNNDIKLIFGNSSINMNMANLFVRMNRLDQSSNNRKVLETFAKKHYGVSKTETLWDSVVKFDSSSKEKTDLRNKIASLQEDISLAYWHFQENDSFEENGKKYTKEEYFKYKRQEIQKAVVSISSGFYSGKPGTGRYAESEDVANYVSVSSSGMSTQQAIDILKNKAGINVKDVNMLRQNNFEFDENSDGKQIIDFIEEFQEGVNRSSLKLRLEEGLITDETYKRLAENKYYVPLNVDMAELENDLKEAGVIKQEVSEPVKPKGQFKVRIKDETAEQKQYTDYYVYDIRQNVFYNSILQRVNLLHYVSENNIRKELATYLKEIQTPDQRTQAYFDSAEMQRNFIARTNPIHSKFSKDYLDNAMKKTTPFYGSDAIRYVEGRPGKTDRENAKIVIEVIEDGKRNNIIIKDDFLALSFADQSAWFDNPSVKNVMSVLRSIGNVQKAVYVTLSPYFLLRNNVRDAGAVLITGANLPAHIAKKVASRTLGQFAISAPGMLFTLAGAKWDGNSLASIYNYKRGRYSDEELSDGKSWAYYADLYHKSGAPSSWINQSNYDIFIREVDALKDKSGVKLAQDVGTIQRGYNISRENASKAFNVVSNYITDLSNAIENNYRLVVFKTALEELQNDGMDLQEAIDKAATAAKYVTVNFEDKGQMTRFINTYKLFFNAGIQGTYNLYKFAKNPRIRRILSSVMLSGVLNRMLIDFLAHGLLDEEDKDKEGRTFKDRIAMIHDYEYSNNWIVPLTTSMKNSLDTDADFIRIPIPYGINFFKQMGDVGYRVAATEKHMENPDSKYHAATTPGEGAQQLLLGASASYAPVKLVGQNGIQVMTPTALMPIANLAVNKNYLGLPVYREPGVGASAGDASHLTAMSSTPQLYKDLARGVNNFPLVGSQSPLAANELLDNHPETYREIMKYYIGSFFGNAVEGMYDMGVDMAYEKVPQEGDPLVEDIGMLSYIKGTGSFIAKPFLGKGKEDALMPKFYELFGESKKRIQTDYQNKYVNKIVRDEYYNENPDTKEKKDAYDNFFQLVGMYNRNQRRLKGIKFIQDNAKLAISGRASESPSITEQNSINMFKGYSDEKLNNFLSGDKTQSACIQQLQTWTQDQARTTFGKIKDGFYKNQFFIDPQFSKIEPNIVESESNYAEITDQEKLLMLPKENKPLYKEKKGILPTLLRGIGIGSSIEKEKLDD